MRKEALYYGINALSNNLIMVDRKLLKNPNGLILGTPGSGKSFSAKREIANSFLLTSDDVIICDPEAEYAPLVERLHGQVIKISPTSTNYINPMDLNLDYSDDESPLSLKSDLLNIDGKGHAQPETVVAKSARPSVLDSLKRPVPPRSLEKKPKQHEEVTSFFSGEKELGKTLEQLAVRRAMSEVSTPASCSAHTAT